MPLDKLVFALAPRAAGAALGQVAGAADSASGFLQTFAKQFQTDASNESTTANLGPQVRSAISEHLESLGLPQDTPFEIEISALGKLWVEADSEIRGLIEDAISEDTQLHLNLSRLASQHAAPGEPFRFFWPSSGPNGIADKTAAVQ